MSSEMKNIIDRAVSLIGITRVIHGLKNDNKIFNIKTSESDEEIMDYLNYLLMKERDQKISALLEERKIYKFSEFISL